MKEKIKIEGMKCPKCAAHVDQALSKIAGVKSSTTDHATGISLITTDQELDENKIDQAISEAGYKFISVEKVQEEQSIIGKNKGFFTKSSS